MSRFATVHQFHTVLPDLTFCGLPVNQPPALRALRRGVTREANEEVTHGRWEGVNCECCLDPTHHVLVHYAPNLYAPDGEGLPAICGYREQDDRRAHRDTITTDDTRRSITCERCLCQMRMQPTPPPPVDDLREGTDYFTNINHTHITGGRVHRSRGGVGTPIDLSGGDPFRAALMAVVNGLSSAAHIRTVVEHARPAGVSMQDLLVACFPDEINSLRFMRQTACEAAFYLTAAGEDLDRCVAPNPSLFSSPAEATGVVRMEGETDVQLRHRYVAHRYRDLILDKATDLVRRWLEEPDPLTYLNDKRRRKLEHELAMDLELCPVECDRGQHPALPGEAEPYRCRTCHGTGFVRKTE